MSVKDKKFYWLKLKAEFMTGDTIDFLMSQKNGSDYVVLYQMLCIKTINTHGELATKIGEVLIPFDVEKIQRECKWFDIDTVIVAMELYKKLGLIYEQENGVIKIANFENIVGSETYWAQQKRIEREANDDQKQLENGVGQTVVQSLEDVQNPLSSNILSLSSKEIIESTSIYNINNNNKNDNDLDNTCNMSCLKELLRLYPEIENDISTPAFVDEPDYSVVIEKFGQSVYLRTQCKSLSWIIKNHKKIESGFYADKMKQTEQQDESALPPCEWVQDETGAWKRK